MIYTSQFFNGDYGNVDNASFDITEDDIQKIKNLKSYRSDQSGYYNLMLQWRLSDNLDVVKDKEELSRLFVCMQLISATAIIKDYFIKDYNNKKAPYFIEDYHKFLLRRLYLDYDDYDDTCITMAFKRPFGNSHVLGDIREEIDNVYKMSHDEYESGDYEREEKVLCEFIDFLELFYKGGFETKCNYFVYENPYSIEPRRKYSELLLDDKWGYLEGRPHSYLMSWNFNPSEIRNIKIEKILDI